MVSFTLLLFGLLLIAGGAAYLLFFRKPEVWIWVGQGEDPFKVLVR